MGAASHDKTQPKGSVLPKLVCDGVLVFESWTVTNIMIKSSCPVKQRRDHGQRNHSDVRELHVFNLPKCELPDWLFHRFTGTIQLCKNQNVPVGCCA